MKKLKPETSIIGLKDMTICDYWSWAYSDVLSNRNRSIFAEYLIAHALDADTKPRIEWDAYDCIYKGKGIEVKSAAYVQSWKQNRLSYISFDIATKQSWYSETNTYAEKSLRSSFCYVFCLLNEKDKERVNPLSISQWDFFVVPTDKINKEYSLQKSISLSVLNKFCKPVSYVNLKQEVDKYIDSLGL